MNKIPVKAELTTISLDDDYLTLAVASYRTTIPSTIPPDIAVAVIDKVFKPCFTAGNTGGFYINVAQGIYCFSYEFKSRITFEDVPQTIEKEADFSEIDV